MSYRITIQKHQIQLDGVNKVIQCINGVASYVNGSNADTTIYDISSDVANLNDIEFSWDIENQEGDGVFGDITVSGDSFFIIREWLYCTPCSNLQSFDVVIEDTECGLIYDNYYMKADALKYCMEDECTISLTIREENDIYKQLDTTTIFDNTFGWFDGVSIMQYPCFPVAIENQAAGSKLGINLLWQSMPYVAIVNASVSLILTPLGITFLDVLDSTDSAEEALGLNNYAPAPQLRVIALNLCNICGLTLDSFLTEVEFFNDCWLETQGAKYHNDNSVNGQSDNTWFFAVNGSLMAGSEWLDIVCSFYNASWWIEGTTLKMVLNKDLDTNVIDFTSESQNICYEYNGIKKKALYKFQYASDEGASGEINPLYSGYANWDSGNPMLEGVETNQSRIASTGFLRDGTVRDYTRLAVRGALTTALIQLFNLALVVASLIAGIVTATGAVALSAILVIWVYILFAKYINIRNKYTTFNSKYTGIVRIKNSNAIKVPRILRWDGVDTKFAKVVAINNPIPRSPYNSTSFKTKYSLNADDGNPSSNNGSNSYRAFNYPLYFDQQFQSNLYDLHEPTINHNNNADSNQTVTFLLCKTCDILTKLGLEETQYKILNKLVQIKNTSCFGNKVRIKAINLKGNIITITGNLFRK